MTAGTDISSEALHSPATHPCLSEQAAARYGRMHLPVAPACDVRCNYCYRRFDCSNESIPGVASRVLSPLEALERVREVLHHTPEVRVIGISGPGDPLSNPAETFRTMELIRETYPSVALCLATNGLSVIEHIAELKFYGVQCVSITVNAVDPRVGMHIYRWIRLRGTARLTGIEAGKALVERQIAGLGALAGGKILTKINTVLIPTINDHHIEAVASVARRHRVHAMNIIPLMPLARTPFELMPPPTPEAITRSIDACSRHLKVISHCRRCRSDAVGLLIPSSGLCPTRRHSA
jgi:nitrogen fixation protein NifB